MLICFESLRCFVKPKKKRKKKEKLKSLNHSETSMSLQNRFMQLFFSPYSERLRSRINTHCVHRNSFSVHFWKCLTLKCDINMILLRRTPIGKGSSLTNHTHQMII